MKKTISLLLALVLCLSLCACGGGNKMPEIPEASTETTLAPTEEKETSPTAEKPTSETTQPTEETTQPTEEEVEALYTPYIGKWVCSDDYYVIVNEDGTLIYNDVEYTPEYFEMGNGVAVHLEDATYTYANGTQTGTGCVFVWGLTERFGEGVMIGDHDGRKFILQAE